MIELEVRQARVFLKHLAMAEQKFSQRKASHKKLHQHIKKVRKHVKKEDADDLEKSISDALDVEKKIISRQAFEMAYTELLGTKIKELDAQIQKIEAKPPKKKLHPAVVTMRRHLASFERRLTKIRKMEGYDKKKIAFIEEKIKKMKLNIARH